MKKLLLSLTILGLSSSALASCPDYMNHDLRKLHSKETVNLCETHAGKPMLIVNTASHCGFTGQFEGLEALYKQYKDRGFEVVGFASDSFKQEDDSEEKAAEVCFVNYGVTFTMMAPTPVRGDDVNPVFKHLNEKTSSPSWNFNKYLVNAEGEVLDKWGSMTRPDDKDLVAAIEAVL